MLKKMFEYRPVSKASQTQHNRLKKKRGQHTAITQKVRREVERRSGKRCERCGRSRAYSFEMAHLTNASQYGSGSEPFNIALLCGPRVNSGTCHQWVDETREGREWKQKKRLELIKYYETKGDNVE